VSAARELLEALQARGVELVASGDRLRFRPTHLVTADESEALRQHKVELLRLLQESTGTLSEATVTDFTNGGWMVELYSRTLRGTVWLVPNATAGAALLLAGTPRHRIYLAEELLALRDLLVLPATRRAGAIRLLDAVRETLGPVDVIGVRAMPSAEDPTTAVNRDSRPRTPVTRGWMFVALLIHPNAHQPVWRRRS
jgi:tubulysin polyketide synthase-like protein